jgi:hypothetical protein
VIRSPFWKSNRPLGTILRNWGGPSGIVTSLLGPNRALAEAGAARRKEVGDTAAARTIKRWCTRFSWVIKGQEYDTY